MKKNTHREPTLYIVGNEERADEIRHIIEDEWRGDNVSDYYKYNGDDSAYYISAIGVVSQTFLKDNWFAKAVENGWMKEYKLSEKPKFKPFDKVVVKANGSAWKPALFGYIEGNDCWLQGYGWGGC